MRRLALALVAALALGACGESASGISESASLRLVPQVEQVKVAAMGGDQATAALRLAELRKSVADLRQSGELTEAGAAEILAAAAAVEAQLGAGPAPIATTVPAPVVTGRTGPPATPGGGRGGNDDDKGKGNGNGRDD